MYLDNWTNTIEFQGQRSRSRFFWCFLCAQYGGYPRTVLSLEQGLIMLFVIWPFQQAALRILSVRPSVGSREPEHGVTGLKVDFQLKFKVSKC